MMIFYVSMILSALLLYAALVIICRRRVLTGFGIIMGALTLPVSGFYIKTYGVCRQGILALFLGILFVAGMTFLDSKKKSLKNVPVILLYLIIILIAVGAVWDIGWIAVIAVVIAGAISIYMVLLSLRPPRWKKRQS